MVREIKRVVCVAAMPNGAAISTLPWNNTPGGAGRRAAHRRAAPLTAYHTHNVAWRATLAGSARAIQCQFYVCTDYLGPLIVFIKMKRVSRHSYDTQQLHLFVKQLRRTILQHNLTTISACRHQVEMISIAYYCINVVFTTFHYTLMQRRHSAHRTDCQPVTNGQSTLPTSGRSAAAQCCPMPSRRAILW